MPLPVSEAEFLAQFAEVLRRADSATFVAEMDGRPAGFISGGIEQNPPDRLPRRHATIGYLYVEEDARRRGAGRALFEAVAGWAGGTEGVAHFEMAVISADEAAAAFWRSLGFTPFISRLWAPLPVEDIE